MNNTRVFRFLSIALLAAIALYFAAQGYFALTDPFTTTLVYQSSAEDTIDVSGWLVRDEEVLSGESGTVRHEVSEGERVGKGQTWPRYTAAAMRWTPCSRSRPRSCSCSSCNSPYPPI